MKKRTMALLLALTLVVGAAVGGTIAWLTDETEKVENTFTAGNIDIDLTETDADNDGKTNENSYKMVPGNIIEKDPLVTVKKDSEACWLFVQVKESDDKKFGDYMEYTMADGWMELGDGVYYREVPATTDAAADFQVLANDQVKVKDSVTKDMMNILTAENYPTLTFKAFAVQKDNIADATTAWAQIPATDKL